MFYLHSETSPKHCDEVSSPAPNHIWVAPNLLPYTVPSPLPSKSFNIIRPSRLCTFTFFWQKYHQPTSTSLTSKKKEKQCSNTTFSLSLLSPFFQNGKLRSHGASVVVTWCLVPRLSKVDAHRHPLQFPSGSCETSPQEYEKWMMDGPKGSSWVLLVPKIGRG